MEKLKAKNILALVLVTVVIAAAALLSMEESNTAGASEWFSSYEDIKQQLINGYTQPPPVPEVTVVYELAVGNHRLGLLRVDWDGSQRSLIPICATENEHGQWSECGGGGIGTVGAYGPEEAPYDISLSWTAFRLPLSYAPQSRSPQLVIGLYGFVREGVPIRRIEVTTSSGETHPIRIFEDGLPFMHLYAADTLGGHEPKQVQLYDANENLIDPAELHVLPYAWVQKRNL